MSVETLRGAPPLPGQRPIPSGERTAPAVGPMPWLTATGRLDQVLDSWGRGQLAEVPVGLGFDVLRTPGAVAEDTVQRMREAGRRMGLVILGPSGAEFLLERGSAPRWSAPRSQLLVPGTLVLLPPPTVCHSEAVACRGWLVPPAHEETGAPLCAEVTPGGALLEPYLAAVQAAEDAEASSEGW
ncbi:hypothetical protein [Streptomyces bicolor]|uniref:hypothetical protein n=1 Tax=Streptomyces bicolor TaxID=66874 RepID=UPI0004E0C5F8|nr:hypothetical protein [Streptomyces bicolor]